MKRISIIAIIVTLATICIKAADNIHIVFIGNSISYGALLNDRDREAPPTKAVDYIRANSKLTVDFANCGVSGATTVDFLPATETLFKNVVNAANTFESKPGTIIFTISLGTNDSACNGPMGSPVLPQQYYTNLKVIVDELLTTYKNSIVVIQYPIWYSPNTYNGAMYLKAGLNRLQTYVPEIDKLVSKYASTHPRRVMAGEKSAFDTFKDNYAEYFTPENGNAGTFYLHPNKTGAEILGNIWAKTILNALTQSK